MPLLNELRDLVSRYSHPESYVPLEWRNYPVSAEDAKQKVIAAFVNRDPLPSGAHWGGAEFDIYCYHLPAISCPGNPNGYAISSTKIDGYEILEAIIDARIKSAFAAHLDMKVEAERMLRRLENEARVKFYKEISGAFNEKKRTEETAEGRSGDSEDGGRDGCRFHSGS